MQYTINNITIIDKEDKFKHILDQDFLKRSNKQKLELITSNIRIYYNESISNKFLKIKAFLIDNKLIDSNIDQSILNKFIYRLLAKLVYEYSYLLK